MTDLIDNFFNSRNTARTSVNAGIDGNADEAAHQQSVSQASGFSPSVVASDPEFDRNFRSRMAGSIVDNNQYIQNYINRNPLAATISNDDYANLDGITQSLSSLRQNQMRSGPEIWIESQREGVRQNLGLVTRAIAGLLPQGEFSKAVERKGREIETTREALIKFDPFDIVTNLQRGPYGTLLVWLGHLASGGNPSAVPLTDAERATYSGRLGSVTGGLTASLPSAATGGLPGMAVWMGLAGGQQMGEEARSLGASPDTQAWAFTVGFAINSIMGIVPVHYLMSAPKVTTPGILPLLGAKASHLSQSAGVFALSGEAQKYANVLASRWLYNPQAAYHFDFNEFLANATVGGFLGSVVPVARTYQRSGREVPIGLHPEIDNLYRSQIDGDLAVFDELVKQVNKSSTRERSPEMMARLIREVTDQDIYIPFARFMEAFEPQLFKENHPSWIPDLENQLVRGALTGADIRIPLADWLARTDQIDTGGLREATRMRRDGLTVEEGRELQEQAKQAKEWGLDQPFEGPLTKLSDNEFGPIWSAATEGMVTEDGRVRLSISSAEREALRRSGIDISDENVVAATDREAILTEGDRRKRAARTELLQVMEEIEAYHGSPHSFDALSMNRVRGSGPYGGHAIYLTTDKGIAGDYARDILRRLPKGEGESNVYRVRVRVNESDLIDLDLPLNQQPKQIQDRLAPFIRIADESVASRGLTPGLFSEFTPLRQELRRILGSDEAVSDALVGAGLPGVKYENLGFREGKGEGRHYAIFDDSLIEILDRNGEAVNAVRQQAGLEPLLQLQEPRPKVVLGEGQTGGQIYYFGSTTKAYVKPKDLYTRFEAQIDKEVGEILARIAPDGEWQSVQQAEVSGRRVQGAYLGYSDRVALILLALNATDPVGTARHEAMHYLRQGGFFTHAEWEILKQAAIDGGWIERHGIGRRYEGQGLARMLEEAIAEQYSKVWAANSKNVDRAVNTIFEKISKALAEILEGIERIIGRKPTADELFSRIESGEIGSRTGAEPLDPRAYREKGKGIDVLTQEEDIPATRMKQGELDVTRQEDKPLFGKGAISLLTVPNYRRIMDLINQRNQQDITAQRQRVVDLERKQQTAEWKENREQMRTAIETAMRERQDIAAADFFRYGVYNGDKLPARPRLNEELLTPEQRAQLPEQWVSKTGMHPDDAANFLGFTDGNSLIESLLLHETARGNTRPGEFFNRLVNQETDRRMVQVYGDLDANILSRAEDHALGHTQMDLIHEETLALGTLAGKEVTITKADMQQMVDQNFAGANASKVSSTEYLNLAGRITRKIETSMIKEDWATAFQLAQQRQLAVMMAKEAKAFEKETTSFERIETRFTKREVGGVDQAYTDFIQKLFLDNGIPVRRSMEEVQANIERGGFTSLSEFVTHNYNDGWELQVAPWLADGHRRTQESMTVEQMREFRTAIRSLQHAGREVRKVEIAGEKKELADLVGEISANIETLPMRPPEARNLFYRWDATLARMEEIIKDLDLRQKVGPLWDAVYRPLVEAKHSEYSLTEALVKNLNGIRDQLGRKWRRSLDDTIPQDFFYDPYYNRGDSVLFDMTRSDLIGIMLNWGNRSNIEAFIKGWTNVKDSPMFGHDPATFEAQLKALIDQHATREDWSYVTNMWKIFETWQKPIEEMYYKLSGVPPKMIQKTPFQTPHGEIEGGYFPIIRDRARDARLPDKPGMDTDAFFGPNQGRMSPANFYTVERTGYIGPVKFQNITTDILSRMQQQMHDLSYRQALMQARKVLRDPTLRNAIRKHYGPEYLEQVDPWLKDIANQFSIDTDASGVVNDLVRRARLNLVSYTLPFNLKMYLSPDVGQFNPIEFSRTMANYSENMTLAMEKSKELPHTFRNMDRDFREQMERVIGTKGFEGWTQSMVRAGFKPAVMLSQLFRLTTWTREYKNALNDGLNDGAASAHADSMVRTHHGSGAVMDLSSIMRGNEYKKMLTIFGGYFSAMHNWSRQLPGNLRRGEYADFVKSFYGSVVLGTMFGWWLYTKSKEDDSIWKSMGKALIGEITGRVPVMRDLFNAALEGYRPSTPIGSSIMAAIQFPQSDLKRLWEGKPLNKPVKHAAAFAGLAVPTIAGVGALPLGQMGNTGQFAFDLYRGKQRVTPFERNGPRNIAEWFRGIVHGESKLKR